jgi:beclin 1
MLDPTISSLSTKQHDLLATSLPDPGGPSRLSPRSKLSSLPPSSRQGAIVWADSHHILLKPVAESFILLGESTINLPSASPNHVTNSPNLAANLHAILSSRTPISHPLCVDCTSMLQAELQKELEELSRERDAYIHFEKGILRNREDIKGKRRQSVEGLGEHDIEGDEDEWQDLTNRVSDLEDETVKLRRILAEKEQELDARRQEEQEIAEEEREVDRLETE